MLLNTFVIKALGSSSLRTSSPFAKIARSHARAARQRRRECEGRELCINWSILDDEKSLFFLGPSSKTPETRKWPRAWLKAPPSFLVSHGFAAQRSHARALPLLNLKKKRDCSQSRSILSSAPRVFATRSRVVLRVVTLAIQGELAGRLGE